MQAKTCCCLLIVSAAQPHASSHLDHTRSIHTVYCSVAPLTSKLLHPISTVDDHTDDYELSTSTPIMSSGHETLTASSLCTICASIFTSKFHNFHLGGNARPHHTTWESLQRSAKSGCYICERLWEHVEGPVDTRFLGIEISGDDTVLYDFNLVFEIHWSYSDESEDRWPSVIHFPCLQVGKATNLGIQMLLQSGTCSNHSMKQARDWIERCGNTHSRCTVPKSKSWLPTRLVYVERTSTSTMFAKICDGESLEPGTSYLTLSHRWGTSKFTTLISDVLESWRKKLPIEQLSQVFQDALHVTPRTWL